LELELRRRRPVRELLQVLELEQLLLRPVRELLRVRELELLPQPLPLPQDLD
jgi:hypothetical protein